MAGVVWTPVAESDLDDIVFCISLVEAVRDLPRQLETPLLGVS